MQVRLIHDPERCEQIWRELQSPFGPYQEWEFRLLFHRYTQSELYFYALLDHAGDVIACLPLQWSHENGRLEYFGGVFMEDNAALYRPGHEDRVPELYQQVWLKASLDDIGPEDPYASRLRELEAKYVLDLEGLQSIDDYAAKFLDGKSRANFQKKLREVQTDFAPDLRRGHAEDLEVLIDWNVRNFGKESSFLRPRRREIFREMLKLDERPQFTVDLLGVQIDGQMQGASLSIFSGKSYVYLNAGVNKTEFPNLGSWLIAQNIRRAIELGAEIFDAGLEDLGWKERWHLRRVPQFILVR